MTNRACIIAPKAQITTGAFRFDFANPQDSFKNLKAWLLDLKFLGTCKLIYADNEVWQVSIDAHSDDTGAYGAHIYSTEPDKNLVILLNYPKGVVSFWEHDYVAVMSDAQFNEFYRISWSYDFEAKE